MITRRNLLSVAIASAVLPLAAACAATPQPQSTAAPTVQAQAPAATPAPGASSLATVRVGLIGSTSDSGFYIAEERGYFKEQGIEFQAVPFQSGPDMVAPAGNGQLEIATGAPSAGLFNAIARGIPLRIVADKGSQRPGFVFSSIVIRKDLLDSGTVKGWADLKGKAVGLAGLGNSGQVFLDKALNRGGLTWHDVDVKMLSYADIGAALANKSLDAGNSIEPFRTLWPAGGIAGYLPDDSEVYVDQQAAVVMYGPQFIQNQLDAARRFMVAYLRGVRDYNDAFVKKINRDMIVDILVRRTSLTDRSLYDKVGFPALDPNGGVLTQDLAAQQDWYVSNGYQNTKLDINTTVDHQFAEFAVTQLGQY